MSDIVLFQPVRVWDKNGVFAPGAKAYFYEPGTTTPRTVYSDAAATVAHPVPLVADARGVFAPVYTSGPIKVTVTDADDATLPGFPMDPAAVYPATDAAAANVTFAATGSIPVANVQAAIERVQSNYEGALSTAGIGITGSATLLANLDATGTAAGVYRFNMDGETTGTAPADWGAAETGLVVMLRNSATAGAQIAVDNTNGNLWQRAMSASTWDAWVRVDLPTQTQATWSAGTSTTESSITPKKLRDTVDALRAVYLLEDRKSNGTAGGGSTSATWVTRDLNTEVISDITGASLATNVVTLPAGIYDVFITAPAYNCGTHQIRLYDVTNSAVLAVGTSEYINTGRLVQTRSSLETRLDLDEETEVQIEHRTADTVATNGFGFPSGSGAGEVYTRARFERLGDHVA